MASFEEALAEATALHRAGKLAEAEVLYRRLLAADPAQVELRYLLGATLLGLSQLDDAVANLEQVVQVLPDHAYAHHHLAVARIKQDKLDEALASFETAWRLKPDSAEITKNLHIARAAKENRRGMAYVDEDRLEEALACFHRALESVPDDAESFCNLGFVLARQEKVDDAIACYRRASELAPQDAEVANNLGFLLEKQDSLDLAEAEFTRAARLKPGYAEALNNLGAIQAKQHKLDAAIASYRQALVADPEFAKAHNNLGVALADQNKQQEAIACYRQALRLQPDYADAHGNLALAYLIERQLDESVACYHELLKLRPDRAVAHYNLAFALVEQHKLSEALASYERAMELQTDYADAHFAHAVTLLLMGRFAEGWPEYEWRFRREGFAEESLPQPRWSGEPLAGQTILLRGEQGLGDAIQFVRYAELLKQQGAKVIVECAASLMRLLATAAGVDEVVVKGQPLPSFDVRIPILSLPGIFGTCLENLPAKASYLSADAEAVAYWAQELSENKSFKIGIAWQGNPVNTADAFRSIPLEQFAVLCETPGVQLYSLQAGLGREQLTRQRDRWPIVDLGDRLGDFYNTAAIVRNLDLVITCDSAPAHLAGALGVPVWTALAFAPDWRWLLERSDSPWYPSMRLFRRSRGGDWPGVFRDIRLALAAVI